MTSRLRHDFLRPRDPTKRLGTLQRPIVGTRTPLPADLLGVLAKAV